MSKANPFNSELSPRGKLFSNIWFFITTAIVIVFIVWVIVKNPDNVRTHYDYIESTRTSVSDENSDDNEFFELYSFIKNKNGIFNDDFKEQYPISTGLLSYDDKIWTENKPYLINSGGYIGVAISYTDSVNRNLIHMDTVLLPVDHDYKDDEATIIISEPIRYSVAFDKEFLTIKNKKVRVDRYKMSFYKINLILEGSLSKLDYTMFYKSIISEKEADKERVFDDVAIEGVNVTPQLKVQDTNSILFLSTDVSNINEGVNATINFNDFMYDYFGKIEFKVKCTDDTGYKIGIN